MCSGTTETRSDHGVAAIRNIGVLQNETVREPIEGRDTHGKTQMETTGSSLGT